MKKLTDSNKLFLKGVCSELGIKGEIDDYGNIVEETTTNEEVAVKKVFGVPISIVKKPVKKQVIAITLSEIMAMKMNMEYDPNALVSELVYGVLDNRG